MPFSGEPSPYDTKYKNGVSGENHFLTSFDLLLNVCLTNLRRQLYKCCWTVCPRSGYMLIHCIVNKSDVGLL